MRGNLGGRHRASAAGGSIPACAGEPGWSGGLSTLRTVYPRVCGGTAARIRSAFKGHGLSPRVRGNRLVGRRPRNRHGSIPACAGEPVWQAGGCGGRRVYPRVCGGTTWCQVSRWIHTGLSPRVRGNRHLVGVVDGVMGSIPACAGEPRASSPWPSPWPVYPRVCGGTDQLVEDVRLAHGLSPRVRGNRERTSNHRHRVRSIPACAGEPDGGSSRKAPTGVYPRVCGGTPWGIISDPGRAVKAAHVVRWCFGVRPVGFS